MSMIDESRPQVVCQIQVAGTEGPVPAIATIGTADDAVGVLEIDVQGLSGQAVKLQAQLPQFQAGFSQFVQSNQRKQRERLAAKANAKA